MPARRLRSKSDESVDTSDERKRAQIPFRTTAATRQRLIQRALANDRSLTQELEMLIDRSLSQEDELGGPRTAQFFRGAAAAIQMIEKKTGKSWTEDTETWRAAQIVIERHVRNWRPAPPDYLKIAHASSHLATANAHLEALMNGYSTSFPLRSPLGVLAAYGNFGGLRSPESAVDEEERASMEDAWASLADAQKAVHQAQAALDDSFAEFDDADERGRTLGTALVTALDLITRREA